jgi:hypothetical protein
MTGLIPSTFFNAQQPLKEVRVRVSTYCRDWCLDV